MIIINQRVITYSCEQRVVGNVRHLEIEDTAQHVQSAVCNLYNMAGTVTYGKSTR